MSQHNAPGFATVTFAIYDEAPIACQGNDDQRKIRVLRNRLHAGADLHARALEGAVTLAALLGLYVQVWDVALDGAGHDGMHAGAYR